MKPNALAPPGPIKAVLIGQIEKVVFGAAACIALYLLGASLFRAPYAETPDDLMRRADEVAARVAQSTPPESFAGLPAQRDMNGLLQDALTEVNPDFFPMSELARPYSDHKVRRRQPKLLAVEDVRAFAGFGAIVVGDQDLGRDRFEQGRRGARWTLFGWQSQASNISPRAGNYDDDLGQAAPPSLVAGNPALRRRNASSWPNNGNGNSPGQIAAGQIAAGRRGRRFIDRRARNRRPKPPARGAPTAALAPEKFALTIPSGAKLEGRYWVAVVGLIPAWEQEAEYRRVFRDATKTFASDVPLYVYCDVERAEVGSAGQPGKFEMLDMDHAADDIAYWAAVYPEPVDPRYLPQSVDVAGPLPPLVFANHDPDRIRHPMIPLAATTVEKKALLLNAIESEPAPKSRRHRTASRGRTSQPRLRQGPAGAMGPRGAWGAPAASNAKQKKTERQLMRFFDFSVEPRKTYRYRVRLALYNPNYSVARYFLADEKLAAAPEIFTAWSPPTAAVLVPAGNELLAGGVDPVEPKAKVLVRQFDSAHAITAVRVFQMSRGSTANADGVEVPLPHLRIDPKSPEPPRTKVDIKTDATMVDLIGGAPLVGGPGGAKAPARILVMNSDGELALLSETVDAARFQIETAKLEAALPKRQAANPRR